MGRPRYTRQNAASVLRNLLRKSVRRRKSAAPYLLHPAGQCHRLLQKLCHRHLLQKAWLRPLLLLCRKRPSGGTLRLLQLPVLLFLQRQQPAQSSPKQQVISLQCLVSPPVCLLSQLLSKSRSSRKEPTEGHAERRLKEKALPQFLSTTALPVQLLASPTLSLAFHTCAFRGSTLTSKTAVFRHRLPTNLTQFQAPIFGERCLISLVIGVGMVTPLRESGYSSTCKVS